MRHLSMFSAVTLLAASAVLAGDGPGSEPRPVPLTRPEMKDLLEAMKQRKPRIPLPEITEEERAKAGERGLTYEGRLRTHYMPAGENRNSFGFNREPDPAMSLENAFKVELFWIVSRANNCQYCLGHQESKLLAAGLKEDDIAALDGDWSSMTPARQAAFAFARKFTYEPHRLNDADIAALRPHYKDLQILEMILSMAGNNAINRWKEGVGVPQSGDGGNFGRRGGEAKAAPATKHTYLTPTSEPFRQVVSSVAPITKDPATGAATRAAVCSRPALESRIDVEKALEHARRRAPRLPLVEEAKAREVLGTDAPSAVLPQWMRLLANFPKHGKLRVQSQLAAEDKGDLPPVLKAQVSWIVFRQDRAWYAAGLARARLKRLGWSDDQVFRLDGDWNEFSPTERALFTVGRKLAASPVVLTDDEVAEAVKLAGPRQVVQLISYVTTQASFGRITEAAGLQLEE